jgi:SAM-dependent methyltransferase
MKIARVIPAPIKRLLKKIRGRFGSIFRTPGFLYAGTGRFCPICEKSSRRFGTAGLQPRDDAQCMQCGAGERHRLVWLYFKRKTNLFDDQMWKMLHVAPEAVFEKKFKGCLGQGYLTADLYNSNAMVKMDITDIQYPNETFDVIYCCHVLEHVPDDKKAMREFWRVLKPKGWAMLLVPVDTDKTIEDLSITDPLLRLEKYGDVGHVRCYGLDYIDRLRDAGFTANMIKPDDFLTQEEITRMGITAAAGDIYFCTKNSKEKFQD